MSTKKGIIFLMIVIASVFNGFSQSIVYEIKSPDINNSISNYVEIFEDSTHKLTFEQISSKAFEHRFHQNKIPKRPFYRNQKGVIWGRFKLLNSTNVHQDIFLTGRNWNSATLYTETSNNIFTQQFSGILVPFKAKCIKLRSATYAISLKPHQQVQYYFCIENENLFNLPTSSIQILRTKDVLYRSTLKFFMLFAGFAGLEWMMIVYALALFYVFRQKNYLWLCLALVANIFYFMQTIGISSYIFVSEPLYTLFVKRGQALFFIPFMILAHFFFLSSFLEFKENFKKSYKYLASLVLVNAVIWPIFGLFDLFFLGATISNYLIIFVLILLSIFIIRLIIKGNRLARIMMYSQGSLIICVIIANLDSLGHIKITNEVFSTHIIIMIGYLFQSLFWTLAVIYKLVNLRNDKEKAQAVAIDALKSNEKLILEQNETLELKVEKRTFELIEKNKIINEEKKRSDELLLNILPAEVAEELKLNGSSKAKTFSMVSVLFTDFKDFTKISETISAELLVEELHTCFSAFDTILQKYNVEKIKTIGDAYMCVSGLPIPNQNHALNLMHTAIEIREFMRHRKIEKEAKNEFYFELRIGVNTGPVVAGIVGIKKFSYDIWGDTVNLAARMETNCEVDKINISGATYDLVKTKFNCKHRGKIEAKNKGMVDMYYLE